MNAVAGIWETWFGFGDRIWFLKSRDQDERHGSRGDSGIDWHRFAGMEEFKMQKYQCGPCGYIYDPEVGDPDGGIAPGTPFENIPDDWVCPVCGLGKNVFEVME